MKQFLPLLKKISKRGKRVLTHLPSSSHHLSILAFLLIIVGLSLVIVNKVLFFQLQLFRLQPAPAIQFHPSDVPVLGREYLPEISAEAAYVMDNDSKTVLFSKREELRFSPASTTKIMTALVGLDTYSLQDILTIQRSGVVPVVVGFPRGVGVTFENILYGMFLPSGNDAAYTVADNYPQGFDGFVEAMNKKAQSLHLSSTHYGDPVGLIDDEDYTTVRDLALLASVAISKPELAKIVGTKNYTIHDTAGNQYQLKNINQLLGKYGVNGIKTGYTEEAGQVLVTSSVQKGHTFIIVVMKSKDRFADTEKLLQMIQDNVTFLPIHI